MENKYEKWAMESLDEITDKLQTGVLFDGENEKLIKKILFEEQARSGFYRPGGRPSPAP